VPLHRRRDFDTFTFRRLSVRDGRDENLRPAVDGVACDDNDDRSVLEPFFLP